MSKHSVLIVEDDLDLRGQLEWALSPTCQIRTAGDRSQALLAFEEAHPFLVILDLGLPPYPDDVCEGLCVLRTILSTHRSVKIIVLTGTSKHSAALEAIRVGAFDYLEKPLDLETLKAIMRRAITRYELEEETRRQLGGAKEATFHGMMGTSPAMQQLYDRVRRAAPSNLPVLICGESGTGKELVARAIHRESSTHNGPFIAINCGAIPEALLESELFGHEKGAFTGAHAQRKGRIEAAQDGTLFLDEVGELSPALQVKLLRFLQDRQIERLGGRTSILVHTRVVAATNVNLINAMSSGHFRQDLFYRLNVIQLYMPPLRSRNEDVLAIAQAFVLTYREVLNAHVMGFSESARHAIAAYHWPGNVRELENRIKRALVLAKGTMLNPADLGLPIERSDEVRPTFREAREEFDRTILRQTLERTKGNISRTAEVLGLTRQAVYDMLSRLGLSERLVGSRT